MDGSIVYSKTPKGVAEVAARSAQLSMTARRILIMIDGRRSIEDLLPVVRHGELDGIISQLEGSGLIQRRSAARRRRRSTGAIRFTFSRPVTGGIEARSNPIARGSQGEPCAN
jgi:hypothetical protein